MNTLPVVQIRTTPSILSIDADPGQFSLRQPKADVQLHTRPAQLKVQSHAPELNVDQSRAFAAYNGGNMIDMNARIYSGMQQIFLQNIANRVQQGNQLAEIHKSGNTIANIIGEDWQGTSFPEMRGPASIDNVDIRFNVRAPELEYTPAVSEMNVTINRPEIEYQRGKLDIYVKQYASIQYTPPAIDIGM
ncbi:hypothetical protein HUB98_14185 [Paenibacillus barcinonensis]|uniref:Uncharacterized protein n=1 Tax=Paenibacillus barcinonensis TaxID=198119 RepID=A0A2V4VBG4_PAEBA|nr:DUF6470 family protein [Paenibacillus barcinonensis]PYE50647.1 hypothetical protein DFQ00_10364 [Paenibacillus barcinonensis]QKS57339.1 hypothetical protein HUB98_14185 [Paenibacillus barcinonensis]